MLLAFFSTTFSWVLVSRPLLPYSFPQAGTCERLVESFSGRVCPLSPALAKPLNGFLARYTQHSAKRKCEHIPRQPHNCKTLQEVWGNAMFCLHFSGRTKNVIVQQNGVEMVGKNVGSSRTVGRWGSGAKCDSILVNDQRTAPDPHRPSLARLNLCERTSSPNSKPLAFAQMHLQRRWYQPACSRRITHYL